MAKVAIDLEHDIQPVSDFRARTSAIIAQLRESGRPVVLTQRGRGAAVLVGIHEYQALLEENETLRDVLAALDDVEHGRVVAHDDVLAEVEKRLGT